jgi:threonine dehydrogenase-like Zn-dependent dehydrogenase
MRALVYQNSSLTLEHDYPLPAPHEGEALIRVLITGICNTDLEIIQGYMGFQGVLGHEFVGVVEQIYGDAALSRYGHLLNKRVVGEINAACYQPDCFFCQRDMPSQCPQRTTLGIDRRDGAFAEYLTLPVQNLYPVPEQVSDEEAVFTEPLAANFEILEQVHLHPTDHVLILGDGKMGQLAGQVLSLSGCNIAMIGHNAEKLALAESRGIHTYRVHDSTHFTFEDKHPIDVVIECSGSEQGFETALRLVRARGTLILKSTVAAKSTLNLAPIVINEIRVQGSRCGPFAPTLRALNQHLFAIQPLISARYTLNEGLQALEYARQKGILKVLMHI